MTEQRNSNLEALRIMAIVVITFYHNAIWGGYSFKGVTANKVWVDALSMYGKIGVNLFVLIAGYFGVCQKHCRSKVVEIEAKTLFVSWSFLAAVLAKDIILGTFTLDAGYIKNVARCLFPSVLGSYWFVSAYIIMLLLAPYLNQFLASLDRGRFISLLILLNVIWSLIPTFTLQVSKAFGMNNYLWFAITYAMGAYIRLHVNVKRLPKRKLCLITAALISVQAGIPVVLDLAGGRTAALSTYFRSGNSVLSVLISLGLFLCACSAEPRGSRLVNTAAGAAFTIYLVQEHILFRPVMWQEILNVSGHQDERMLPLILAVDVGIILAGGGAVHLLYQWLHRAFIGKAVRELNAYLSRRFPNGIIQ